MNARFPVGKDSVRFIARYPPFAQRANILPWRRRMAGTRLVDGTVAMAAISRPGHLVTQISDPGNACLADLYVLGFVFAPGDSDDIRGNA